MRAHAKKQAAAAAPVDAQEGELRITTYPNHVYGRQTPLNDRFEAVETPLAMKEVDPGFELLPHQKITVAALLAIEADRVMVVTRDRGQRATARTNAAVLSEPFGSGKTFEIIAWICIRQIPPAFPTHVKVPDSGMLGTITRRFVAPNVLIRPNLIVVGSAVLRQWHEAIKSVTKLRVLAIDSYYGVKTLMGYIKSMSTGGTNINCFDIVLLKNGTVSGRFGLPSEQTPEGAQKDIRSIVSVVGEITGDLCWSRVVYDDFDTIRLPSDCRHINSLFTVYVSATMRSELYTKITAEEGTLADMLDKSSKPMLSRVPSDTVLFTNYNMMCEKDFVEKSTKITIVNKYVCTYANPDDNYMRLMGVMGLEEARGLMEALNGDAIGEAASMIGIKTTCVGDIFKKLLDTKYTAFVESKKRLDVAEKFRDDVIPELEPHEDKTHTAKELGRYRDQIMATDLPAPDYTSKPLEDFSYDITDEIQRDVDKNGLAINRVIDNVKGGSCQICLLGMEGRSAFIMKCCGLIVCDTCGVKGSKFTVRYDHGSRQHAPMGTCSNCGREISPKRDLIFVDNSVNLQDIVGAVGDEEAAPPPPAPVESAPGQVDDSIEGRIARVKNPKISAILSIVHGMRPKNTETTARKISGLLEGRTNIPQQPGRPVKIIVFAGFIETLQLVEKALVEFEVPFLRLAGTSKEMHETNELFRTGKHKVLLINSKQVCAGLNIQFASAVVFYHKIIDEHVEAQVAGRGQRVGRTDNLDIYFLAYNNERAAFM